LIYSQQKAMLEHDENVPPAYIQKDRIRALQAMGSSA
jgi:hypothetical protein